MLRHGRALPLLLLLLGGRLWAAAPEALEVGRAHLARSELAQARAVLEQAIAADGAAASAEVHLELARCYLAMHHATLAAEQAALVLQDPGATAAALREPATAVLIDALVETTGATEAEETLLGVLPAEHRRAAQAALAGAYADAERHRDALTLYGRLLAEAPEDAEAAGWQVAVLDIARHRGRPADEVAALEALAQHYGPDSTWAQAHPEAAAALVQSQEERERELVLRLGQDVRLMPPGAQATAAANQLSGLYAGWLGRHPDDPDAPQVQYDYATTLLRLGRSADAAIQFEACWQSAPEGPRAAESLEGLAEAAARLMVQPDERARRWIKTLLWAADTHAARFGEAEADARMQVLAAEGLLLLKQEAEALARLEGVVQRWPASPSGALAARRVLEVYITQRDWTSARTAAARFAAQPTLTDPVLRARIDEVLRETERR